MMPSMESRSPVYTDDQSDQQRRQDNSISSYYSSSSAGNQFFPDQAGFTFSAEPSMMEYSAATGTLSTPNHSSVFTPNTGSSFDSLHPDMISQGYPRQTNAFLQHQSQNFSSGMPAAQSLSPSGHSMNDHVSPESYLSGDSIYAGYSQYTTPNYGDQLLPDQLGTILRLDDNNMNAFNASYPNTVPMSAEMNNNPVPGFDHTQSSIVSTGRSESQLLSPCLTNNSSPVVGQDGSHGFNTSGIRLQGNELPPSSSVSPRASISGTRSTPKKQQQSPALTNSPGGVALANPQPRAPHLTSPIVRVENYSRGESPAGSDLSQAISKRSHGSRRSATHLSPFPADDTSDEEDHSQSPPTAKIIHPSADRNEDGSWVTNNPSGQAGLNPNDRDALKEAYVPTIDELVGQMVVAEKNAEVQDWLTKSEVGSEAGDQEHSSAGSHLKPKSMNRRRAKSHNDAHGRPHLGLPFGLGLHTEFDDSGIPGPGVYIDERSEFDEESENDEDGDGDADVEPDSPPAQVEVSANTDDTSYFPPFEDDTDTPKANAVARPWNDVPSQQDISTSHYQPPTSNAAMMRFRQRAKDIESASLAATLGSRRMSESDLGSVRAAPGISKLIEPDPTKSKLKEKRERRPSFLESILPKRTNNNMLKRKGSHPQPQQQQPQQQQQPPPEASQEKPKETLLEKPKRIGSWGRPKSPRLDTSVANQSKDVGPPTSANLSATSGPWAQAKNAIRRSRSRSDLGKSPGLADLWTQHGGPPIANLASPLAEAEANKHSPMPSQGEDDDADEDMTAQDAVIMDLKVRSDPIIPTPEGFKTHSRQLNPRLVDYMVERITQEQGRRYKRLLELRVKHLNAVKNRNCQSAKFCTALGGEAKQLPPRAGNKDTEAPFIGFQITAPGSSDDDADPPPEGVVVSAQFPPGVPLPPVKRLPAEFECPLCFKVKKFYKPSDWTKHVHEDVQPFTCTFPNCGEPKSFKRKADWVRHENERHRQLENWTCCIGDCNHTCYRKDNFVQHLVREHKIAEPKPRTGRAGNGHSRDASVNPEPASAWSAGYPKENSDDIWTLVEKCRRDTTKQPKDEPCRFCGNICNSWKKLTVHLAKHMEQISMPILPLVEQKQMNADTIISPVVEMPEQSRTQPLTPTKSPNDNPSRYNPASNSTSLASGMDQTYPQYPSAVSSAGVASQVMHTYPPPQFVNYGAQQQSQKTTLFPSETASAALAGSSYPGLQDTKPRGRYVNNLQIPSQTYRNGNISNVSNGNNRYPITPISALGQQQPMFTSPVDSTSFSNDNLTSTYFVQEPQSMGYDQGNTMQYPSAEYQQMSSYMPQQQHNYQFQGQ